MEASNEPVDAYGGRKAPRNLGKSTERKIERRIEHNARRESRHNPKRGKGGGDIADTAKNLLSALELINVAASLMKEKVHSKDVEEMLEEMRELPKFPFIMLTLAIAKDISDAGDIVTAGLAVVITTVFSVIFVCVSFFWFMGKMHGKWWKGMMFRMFFAWIQKRALMVAMIGLLPFLKIVPEATVFVLMAHYRETKVVKLMNYGFEVLHSFGITKELITRR